MQPQNQLNPKLVTLAKAIRATESGDNFQARGGSGEYGAYQFMPQTWAGSSTKFGINVPLEQATREQQNEVAYKQLEEWSNQHPDWDVGNFASAWNAGPGRPNAHLEGNVGVNSQGVKYDTPAYARKVAETYQQLKRSSPQAPAPTPAPTPLQVADQESAQQNGAWFPSKTGDDALASGLKAAGNLIPSAFNFGKGVIDALNPVNTVNRLLTEIPQAFGDLSKQKGGAGQALLAAGAEVPAETAKTVRDIFVPQAFQDVAGGVYRSAIGDKAGADKNFESAQRNAVNNPFGTGAQAVGALQTGAGLATRASNMAAKSRMGNYVDNIVDNTANKVPLPKGGTNYSAMVDQGLSKTAQTVTKPVGYAFGKAGKFTGTLAEEAVAKGTGFDRSTIKEIPNLTEVERNTITRQGLAEEVASKLNQRIDQLDEAGDAYKPIRQSNTQVKVDKGFLKDTLTKETGLVFKNGKFSATAKSAVDSAGDVTKVQRLYDAWQPYFNKGVLTADDFLTFRSKLAGIANFEGTFLKSKPLESSAAGVRSALNAKYRGQLKGLDELDANYSTMSNELKELRKGFIDKDGNLTPAATNRIANSGGLGKDVQLAKLEEIYPGITLKLRKLKAIEDIENVKGSGKVGNYASVLKGGGVVGGLATMNLPLVVGSIVTMFLTQPEVAVRMIRGYGKMSGAVADGVLQKIGNAASTVNNITDSQKSVLNTDVKELKPKLLEKKQTQETYTRAEVEKLRAELKKEMEARMKEEVGAMRKMVEDALKDE